MSHNACQVQAPRPPIWCCIAAWELESLGLVLLCNPRICHLARQHGAGNARNSMTKCTVPHDERLFFESVILFAINVAREIISLNPDHGLESWEQNWPSSQGGRDGSLSPVSHSNPSLLWKRIAVPHHLVDSCCIVVRWLVGGNWQDQISNIILLT